MGQHNADSIETPVNGVILEQAREFIYLGSAISDDGRLDAEINRRLGAAAAAFGRLRIRALTNRDLSLYTRVSVYNAAVISVSFTEPKLGQYIGGSCVASNRFTRSPFAEFSACLGETLSLSRKSCGERKLHQSSLSSCYDDCAGLGMYKEYPIIVSLDSFCTESWPLVGALWAGRSSVTKTSYRRHCGNAQCILEVSSRCPMSGYCRGIRRVAV